MLKKFSIGLCAAIIALTAGAVIMPQRAEAAVCKIVKIPSGFKPTGRPCGQPGCSGEVYEHPIGATICVITDTQP